MRNFYKLLPNGYAKDIGVLYPTEEWPFPLCEDGKPVENWHDSLALELKDGRYPPFTLCVGLVNVVDQELKDLFQLFIGEDPNVEFLPVKAISKEYGDRWYYILHFKEVYSEAIDDRHSVALNGSFIKYGLYYEKVKDLKIFVPQPDQVLVCPAIATAMKKRKLNFGTMLVPIRCYKEDE